VSRPMPALEAVGLRKTFGGLHAVEDVSFIAPAGALTALIGPNGAGKTTLFNLVTRLLEPDAGEVRFYGRVLAGVRPQGIARLGLLRTFQTARVFPGMTVLENVLVGAHCLVRAHPLGQMAWLAQARREEREMTARADALLEVVGLGAFRDHPATNLPMGAQKLVELSRALMARPRLLLLDEPAAGLNDAETAELAAMLLALRDGGITILLVEHNMSLVMTVADRVVVLDLGRVIAEGAPQDIQRDPDVRAAYLGPETA
jgi:branched-chain amino acid transport system ATP-binding protein